MYANRYPVLIDACSLAGVLRRNLLLSLAQAEFYRIYWSAEILAETERAIAKIHEDRGSDDATACGRRQRERMEAAFPEAMVVDYAGFDAAIPEMADSKDRHVVAAALKADVAVIVTENVKHFPAGFLATQDIEVSTADTFIANTIDLDLPRATAAIAAMRQRFQKPELTAQDLILRMEAQGLVATAAILLPRAEFI